MSGTADDGLRAELLRLLSGGAEAELEEDEFDRLARSVFRHQYELNPIYRRYCDARSRTPDTVGGWRDIPAVPTDAFKAAPLVCGDAAAAEVVFRTSGTTRGLSRRGTHHLLDTSLYRAALASGFERHLLPQGSSIRILSLVAPFEVASDSSLSFMASEVVRRFGAAGSGFYADAGGLRIEEALGAVREAASTGVALLVLGTSIAFVHLLDDAARRGVRVALPEGSRAMDTGGFKGISRRVRREEIYAAIEGTLGIPLEYIVNEYGMTEMSSQFYDGVAGAADELTERRYRGPGWVRTFAADPETLDPLSDGESGILRHFDLANLDSVMALQTADIGVVEGRGFELRGRARGAEARGCSIAMDDLVEAARER